MDEWTDSNNGYNFTVNQIRRIKAEHPDLYEALAKDDVSLIEDEKNES